MNAGDGRLASRSSPADVDRCGTPRRIEEHGRVASTHKAFDRAPRFILLLVMILAELMLAPLLAESEFGLHSERRRWRRS